MKSHYGEQIKRQFCWYWVIVSHLVSLDLSTQVRALTNKGRALEIRLKSSAREKKEMEQRYCSMLEHRDSELEEKAARIQHLHKMVKELKDKALWNPNHKDIYYRRR